jgi:flagellar basal body-associated protein FliL
VVKLFSKFEVLANALLIRIGQLIIRLLKKFTPIKIQKKFFQLLDWKVNTINKIYIWIKTKKEFLKNKCLMAYRYVIEGNAQKIVFTKLKKSIEVAKKLNPDTFKSLIQKTLEETKIFIIGFIQKINFKAVFSYALVICFFSLLSWFIVKKLNLLSLETGWREIASVPDEPYAVRPPYYKLEERMYHINGLILPIYIESTGSMKSLKMDITLEASNRTTVQFLVSNHAVIRDYLNSEIEAFEPTFPLEPEGRDILKEKIKIELNNFLKQQNVEGQIKKVYLKDILGG